MSSVWAYEINSFDKMGSTETRFLSGHFLFFRHSWQKDFEESQSVHCDSGILLSSFLQHTVCPAVVNGSMCQLDCTIGAFCRDVIQKFILWPASLLNMLFIVTIL